MYLYMMVRNEINPNNEAQENGNKVLQNIHHCKIPFQSRNYLYEIYTCLRAISQTVILFDIDAI